MASNYMILFLSIDNLNSKQGHGGFSFKTWDFIPQNDAILNVIFVIYPLTWTANLRTHIKNWLTTLGALV